MKLLTTLAGLALAVTFGLSALAVQEAKATKATPAADDAAMIAAQIPTYPFETCLVSEEPLDAMGKPKDMLHDGRLVRLCCGSCVKAFDKDPAAMMAKIDQAIVKQQAPNYPLETCPVSGEKLEEPVDVFHGTRLVRLCCKGCIKTYEKDPAAVVAKLDEAYIAQQKPNYPASTCLISGEALGEDAIDMLYGNTLVRLCCKGCVKPFHKDPAAMIAKLEAGAKPAAASIKQTEKAGGN